MEKDQYEELSLEIEGLENDRVKGEIGREEEGELGWNGQ